MSDPVTAPAAPEPVVPDEVVELGARAAVEDDSIPGARKWEETAPWHREVARAQARAALTAAAPAIVAANRAKPADDLRETLFKRFHAVADRWGWFPAEDHARELVEITLDVLAPSRPSGHTEEGNNHD